MSLTVQGRYKHDQTRTASERYGHHAPDFSGTVSISDYNESSRTLYSYLDKGILSARNIDLKRQVKFKPRKVHKTQIKDRSVFIRRMFSDFQALELDHFAEMDTVHSSQDSKRVILTFFLTREKLFLAFIMNRCTKGAVKLVFNKLEHQLGTYDFLTLFNTILTDRGSEFGDPESLENGINGIMRSSIYYCDPMRSGQKRRHRTGTYHASNDSS